MAATTEDRNTQKRGDNLLALIVAAGEVIPAGVMVARNAAGEAVNAVNAADHRVIGRANHAATDEDGIIEVERGVFLWDNDDAGTPVSAIDIGEPCYVLDNQTVTADGNNPDVLAGRVHDIGPGGVWVDTNYA